MNEESGPLPGKCAYRFEHPNKPRDYCGRPIHPNCLGSEPDKDSDEARYCLWHCGCPDATKGERTFEALDNALLDDLYLEGASIYDLDLRGCIFRKGVHLEDVQISSLSETHLDSAHLEGTWFIVRNKVGYCDLQNAYLRDAHLEDSYLVNADLRGAKLDRACLNGARLHGITLDNHSTCVGTKWGKCREEIERNWLDAASVYRTIEQHYRSVSNHHEADIFYLKEMHMLHRLAVAGSPEWRAETAKVRNAGTRWQKIEYFIREFCRSFWQRLVWGAQHWIWGYGVIPSLVFLWMVVIFFVSWGLFWWIGLPFGEAFRLSLVSFPALGLWSGNNLSAAQNALAGVEGICGVLLVSAFLVSLATKYVHRG